MRLGIPGVPFDEEAPTEIVGFPLPADGWASSVLGDLARFKSVVVGPGLGHAPHTIAAVQDVVASAELPLVLDGDGLFAVAHGLDVVRGRARPTVLTPHDGEYEALTGHSPVADRLDARAVPRGRDRRGGVAEGVDDGRGRRRWSCARRESRRRPARDGRHWRRVWRGRSEHSSLAACRLQEAAAAGAFVHGRAGTLGWSDGLGRR